LNSRYIAKDRIFPAVIFSWLTVMVSMIVLYNILSELNPETSIIRIIVYCLGIATGTFLAMKFKIGAGKKEKII
jgi:ABC-type maltose transport system permease subunit